jgi:hypothetical protein
MKPAPGSAATWVGKAATDSAAATIVTVNNGLANIFSPWSVIQGILSNSKPPSHGCYEVLQIP